MHVQEAGPEGVVPPDVGPADVQAGEAEIRNAVGGGDVGLAPGVVRDTGGEGERAIRFLAPQGEEIAVAVPGRQVRAVGARGESRAVVSRSGPWTRDVQNMARRTASAPLGS